MTIVPLVAALIAFSHSSGWRVVNEGGKDITAALHPRLEKGTLWVDARGMGQEQGFTIVKRHAKKVWVNTSFKPIPLDYKSIGKRIYTRLRDYPVSPDVDQAHRTVHIQNGSG